MLEVSCIILAGGKSLRLGYDKVFETVGEQNLLQQVISCTETLGSEMIIVTANEQTIPEIRDYSKLNVVTDVYPGKGPLGGIYTGLVASTSFYNLIVASDMPFLNHSLLRYMIRLSADFDLVVPRVGSLVEPLHAVYSKNCLTQIEPMIKQDRLSVNQLFRLVKTRCIEVKEIEKFDPYHLSFFNINTETDLARARKLVKGDMSNDKC